MSRSDQLARVTGSPMAASSRSSTVAPPRHRRGAAGRLRPVGPKAHRRPPPIDISCLSWRDATRLFFAGLDSIETITGTIDIESGHAEIENRTATTCGEMHPVAWPMEAHGSIRAAHGSTFAPRIQIDHDDGSVSTVLDLNGPGKRDIASSYAPAEAVSWAGRDSLEPHGLLIKPNGPGPYPLVTYVHGGPVHGFRDRWGLSQSFLPLLAAQGYAIFLPNPRGSYGRGQAFVKLVKGEFGGEAAHDILTGVDHLIQTGVADPGRLLISGGSYGGFMATWLVTQTQRFAAAMALCPLTHMRSQYFTAHHPEFLRVFVGEDPFAVGGDYDGRSPLMHARAVKTPTLLFAGGRDTNTPPTQALEFYRALEGQGVPAQLVIYPKEAHGISQLLKADRRRGPSPGVVRPILRMNLRPPAQTPSLEAWCSRAILVS